MNYCLAIIHVGSFGCLRKLDCIWFCSRAGSSWKPLPRVTQVTCPKFYGRTADTHTQDGAPRTTISGFIPSYTHLQPWLNRVCWGYNYLITRQAPSCLCFLSVGILKHTFEVWDMGSQHISREMILEGNPNIWVVNLTEKTAKSPNSWRP